MAPLSRARIHSETQSTRAQSGRAAQKRQRPERASRPNEIPPHAQSGPRLHQPLIGKQRRGVMTESSPNCVRAIASKFRRWRVFGLHARVMVGSKARWGKFSGWRVGSVEERPRRRVWCVPPRTTRGEVIHAREWGFYEAREIRWVGNMAPNTGASPAALPWGFEIKVAWLSQVWEEAGFGQVPGLV